MNEVTIRPYRSGDETAILEGFKQTFYVERSLAHWRWKFLNNPYGGPFVVVAMVGAELACHYAAYPLPLITPLGELRVLHVGDTYTLPKYRGVGRGPTSLLAQAVGYFHRAYCEGKLDLFYGFNRGKIQQLGRMFLRYVPIAPVLEFHKPLLGRGGGLAGARRLAGWISRVAGDEEVAAGAWADQLCAETAASYGLLVKRDQTYLRWRYDDHPDARYRYFVLRAGGRPRGMLVFKVNGDALEVGDALCQPDVARTLLRRFDAYARSRAAEWGVSHLKGWLSGHPRWWGEALAEEGYETARQADQLDLCATFFSGRFDADGLANAFYFTQGDSDLF